MGGILACCGGAVMATAARAYHRRMIDDRVGPSCRGMAGIAAGAAGDMGGVLAGGGSAVVTAGAGTGHR